MSDSIIKVARRFLKEYKIKTLTVDKITEIIINGLELIGIFRRIVHLHM